MGTIQRFIPAYFGATSAKKSPAETRHPHSHRPIHPRPQAASIFRKPPPARFAGAGIYTDPNLFQESERPTWPARFQTLTPYQDPDSIHFLTAVHRKTTMDLLEQGITAIQSGRFESANVLFFDPRLAEQASCYLRTFEIPVTPTTTRSDLVEKINHQHSKNRFNGQNGRDIQLFNYTLTHPKSRYAPDLLDTLSVSMAYAGLEEWLHYLQHLMGGPISQQLKNTVTTSNACGRKFDAESDITAFLLEQNIPLPHCHFKFHPERKQVFPHWKTLLTTGEIETRHLDYKPEVPE